MTFHWKTILLACILLLAGFIFVLTRSAELLSRNYVFVLDQGRDFVAITDIINGQKLTLIGSEIGGGYAGINGIFQGPLHYYILSFFSLLFQGDPYSGIVYMFLFSLMAFALSFFVARVLFKSNLVAAAVSLLVAISPPLISQAKFSWNPHPVSLVVALLFLFTYKAYSKNKKYIFLSALTAALMYNFQIASTVPTVLALLIYFVFIVKLRKIKELAVLFGGLLLGILPFLLFEIRHNFLALNGFVRYISDPNKDSESGYYLINNHLDRFVYNFGDTFSNQTIIPTWLFIGIFVAVFIYLVIREKRKELRSFMTFLLLIIGSTIFILSFLRNHVFMYYLYQLNMSYIFLFGYILYAAYQQKKKVILYVFCALLGLLSVLSVQRGFIDFNNDYYDYGGEHKIKGKMDAIDYIYKDANGQEFGLFIFTPGVFTYPYDYVISWYGAKKYGYMPTQSKDQLFYLLIEEDKHVPLASKGWMDTIIKEGRVTETTTLKSGLVVQKRYGE